MKKTTKLVGEEVKTAGQQHIVDTVLAEIYGINVPQVISCEDCGNKLTVMSRKYKQQDDDPMSSVPIKLSVQSIRARYGPINGTFPVRLFNVYYFQCPHCKKMYFTRVIDPDSYRKLESSGIFNVVDVFENGLFVLPAWKQLETLKKVKQKLEIMERKTTGKKFEDTYTGMSYRMEFFHG